MKFPGGNNENLKTADDPLQLNRNFFYLAMPCLGALIILMLLLPIYLWRGWPASVWPTGLIVICFSFLASISIFRQFRDPSTKNLYTFFGSAGQRLMARPSNRPFVTLLLVTIRNSLLYGMLAGGLRAAILLFETQSLPTVPFDWVRLFVLFLLTASLWGGFGALLGAFTGGIVSIIMMRAFRSV